MSLVAAKLADAIARHELDVSFVPMSSGATTVRAYLAWPQLEEGGCLGHNELMQAAERCGLRRELQAWLLQAAACQIALRTRAGTAMPVELEAKRGDFGRFDVEAAAVRWGIDPDLLVVRYARTEVGRKKAA